MQDQARKAYDDPNIHFNTDKHYEQRHLVFGDGTPLPADGTLVYRNAETKQNWIQNDDGTVNLAGPDGKPVGPATAPAGYRKTKDGLAQPIDASGRQIGQTAPFPPSPNGWQDTDGVYTPKNADGDYYTLDTKTGKPSYFDKDGKPIAKEQYDKKAGKPGPKQPAPQDKKPDGTPAGQGGLHAPKAEIPAGMIGPVYPTWATTDNPDIPNQMSAVLAKLYSLFGEGTPSSAGVSQFPFNTDTGEHSGIDQYEKVKKDFKKMESEFSSTVNAFNTAVGNTAARTKKGRDAINDAIGDFNTKCVLLNKGDWEGLLNAEANLLDKVRSEVTSAAGHDEPVPAAPGGNMPATPGSPAPAPSPADPLLAGKPDEPGKKDDLKDLLGKIGAPFGGGLPGLGGANPLGALGGMNPLGGGGGGINPLGGGSNPLSNLGEGIKPLAKLADQSKPDGEKKPAVTPLNNGPQTPPPPVAAPPATPAPAGGQPQPGTPTPAGGPAISPAGDSKSTVTLPDGKVVTAPNGQQAQAAQNALDHASPGGDAAQKAYDGTGVHLPGDGKNPGARVDPADMQAGDILKWKDKTMVAVGPGLVADDTHPNHVMKIEEVLKDGKGFEGIFRPTATDPTLSSASSAPPLHDNMATPPQQHSTPGSPPAPAAPPASPPGPQAPPAAPPALPGGDSTGAIPLSGQMPPAGHQPAAPAAAGPQPQPAPPSPFGPQQPPAATRSTKDQRIAAGQS